METVVLDSSVIVKAIVRPGRWLPTEVYRREAETHVKARRVIELLKKRNRTVVFPFPVLVEVAAVVSRLLSKELAERTVESLRTTTNYIVVDERDVREEAIKVAIRTGSSGFDAYILATALKYNAILITDDEPMSIHAKKEKLECILLRSISSSELESLI